jgi:predicted esterase
MVFDSQFFRDTMHFREQLVSPALKPSNVFPWIQQEQQLLSLKHQKIILISGKDDLVVSEKSVVDLKNHLEGKNNLVFLEMANRLSHNAPELASSLIKKLIKDHDFA